jgi:formylmethanofuran dehydrogenase subunit E
MCHFEYNYELKLLFGFIYIFFQMIVFERTNCEVYRLKSSRSTMSCSSPRTRLRPKCLHSNRFYKGHKEIAEKASHHLTKNLFSTKTVFKSLAILEKASISRKKSSKIFEIFIKGSHFLTEAYISLEMSSKSLFILIKA